MRPDLSRYAELSNGKKLTVVSGKESFPVPSEKKTDAPEVKALDPDLSLAIAEAVAVASEKADQVIAVLDKEKPKERWSFTVFRDENNRISVVEAVQL